MRATTILKASQLMEMVTKANQFHPLWRNEHFANGEHNSRVVPVSVVDVDSAGAMIAQRSVKAAGVVYAATSSRMSLGRYLITLDAGITIETASASPCFPTASTAEVSVISANTVQVRTYTVSASGTFSATDMDFALVMSAAQFPDAPLAALTTSFAIGGFPVASKLVGIINAQNSIYDMMRARHSDRAVHTDVRNPMAIGRIDYSGGNYTVLSGSLGIVGATKTATGECLLDFEATAATRWNVKVTPIDAAAYSYYSARTVSSATIGLFSTISKPTYAMRDGPFYVAGWAL